MRAALGSLPKLREGKFADWLAAGEATPVTAKRIAEVERQRVEKDALIEVRDCQRVQARRIVANAACGGIRSCRG